VALSVRASESSVLERNDAVRRLIVIWQILCVKQPHGVLLNA
jgi:hypothetical protein